MPRRPAYNHVVSDTGNALTDLGRCSLNGLHNDYDSILYQITIFKGTTILYGYLFT